MRLGWGIGLNDAELMLRSLPTLVMRYAAQDRAGRAIAEWLSQRREITRVLHPALPGSPGFAHWQQTCTAAAGLFSVEFDPCYTGDEVDAFVDALHLFKIGVSWAGPVSLVVPYKLQGMRTLPVTYAGIVVRLSIGFEAVEDLIADLQQAMETAFGRS
jgi:cystathionine beta-lyase